MTLIRTKTKKDGLQGMFDYLFSPELFIPNREGFYSTQTAFPKVNIREVAGEFLIELAAPGMKKSDFQIQLDQDLLTVSSDKKEEFLKQDQKYSRREFSQQTFRRSFTLPDIADTDNINANYLEGVLLIQIPKKEEAKPQPSKTIMVN